MAYSFFLDKWPDKLFGVFGINAIVILVVLVVFEVVYLFVPKSDKVAEIYIRGIMGENLYPIRFPYIGLDSGMVVDGRDIFPFSDASYKDSIFCNENGYWTTYTSDRFGFANDDLAYEDSVDVMIVGDSYAQGACVRHENSSQAILRDEGYNTISLGMGSNGPLIELASLKEYFSEIHPRYVVWYYYEGNDLGNLSREMKNPVLVRYLDGNYTQGLPEIQKEISEVIYSEMREAVNKEALASINGPIDYLKKYGFISQSVKALGFSQWDKGARCLKENWQEQQLRDFEKVIREAHRYVNENGVDLIFVYLPSYETIIGPCVNDYYQKKRVISIAESYSDYTIDFSEVVQGYDDKKLAFPNGTRGHYTEKAYTDLALTVANKISVIGGASSM